MRSLFHCRRRWQELVSLHSLWGRGLRFLSIFGRRYYSGAEAIHVLCLPVRRTKRKGQGRIRNAAVSSLLPKGWALVGKLCQASQSTQLLEAESEGIQENNICQESVDALYLHIVSFGLKSSTRSPSIDTYTFLQSLAFSWLKGLDVDGRACKVNCSNIVMSNGKGYVRGSHRCALCGRRGGLKARCADLNCRARGERRNAYHFHVTCAREAGLEVNHDDQLESEFYGTLPIFY